MSLVLNQLCKNRIHRNRLESPQPLRHIVHSVFFVHFVLHTVYIETQNVYGHDKKLYLYQLESDNKVDQPNVKHKQHKLVFENSYSSVKNPSQRSTYMQLCSIWGVKSLILALCMQWHEEV